MTDTAVSSSLSSDPRRAAIIRHARRQFMSVGYAGTRIEPIARDANVSTATLYTYFAGKAELFEAVIDDAAVDFIQRMQFVQSASGSAREQLTLFAEAYGDFMADPFVRSIFRLVMAERPRFQEIAANFFEIGRKSFGADLIEALKTLSRAGQLKIDNPSWAAGQLMGMMEHPVFFVPLVTGDAVQIRRSVPEIAADAVETFLARYGVSGASGPETGPAPVLAVAIEA
ncbi:TetR/AcrR family transcriptional regulator [uncultured Brevundimonas sp.]|uniref:TetR/AcrR family transcriptional regulator n=1 Tax=uncultured Brevundimonas sp. TaxID=213418 RepID=UPI0030EDE19B|tara:strand:- start:1743 stop:2426 length:684 start_codon:yes stop_codon:yes gene_type:complete